MVCLFRIYSVVYGPVDPILGMEVGGRHEITVGLLVSMETDLILQEIGYILMAQPIGQ